MKRNNHHRIRAALGALAASLCIASNAHALSVAGWDFSQYASVGLLAINANIDPADTLPANYSNLDATLGAGAESANFGTMYMNGLLGSTDVAIDFSGNEPIVPTSNSLAANLNQPQLFGGVPFDTHGVLQAEGQTFANLLGMTAQDAVNIVFSANWDSVPEFGNTWTISFGARVFDLLPLAAETAQLTLRYSLDGAAYSAPIIQGISEGDVRYEIPLAAGPSERMYVLMSFTDPSGQANGGQIILDNVSINALSQIPEPSTALLLFAGLVGIAAVGRRRA